MLAQINDGCAICRLVAQCVDPQIALRDLQIALRDWQIAPQIAPDIYTPNFHKFTLFSNKLQ